MVAQRQVAVVVDSSACLPTAMVDEWQVTVVPHTLMIDDAILRDGVDIDPAQFYKLQRQGLKAVTTSAPSPRAFHEAFTHAHSTAPDILCIVVASRLSAAYDAAQVARTTASRAIPSLRVHVLDSLYCCRGRRPSGLGRSSTGLLWPLARRHSAKCRADHPEPAPPCNSERSQLSASQRPGRPARIFGSIGPAHQSSIRVAPRRTPSAYQAS